MNFHIDNSLKTQKLHVIDKKVLSYLYLLRFYSFCQLTVKFTKFTIVAIIGFNKRLSDEKFIC